MWILNIFYNIIIKSADVDKGGEVGGKTLIHKMWIDVVFFVNPSLTALFSGGLEMLTFGLLMNIERGGSVTNQAYPVW